MFSLVFGIILIVAILYGMYSLPSIVGKICCGIFLVYFIVFHYPEKLKFWEKEKKPLNEKPAGFDQQFAKTTGFNPHLRSEPIIFNDNEARWINVPYGTRARAHDPHGHMYYVKINYHPWYVDGGNLHYDGKDAMDGGYWLKKDQNLPSDSLILERWDEDPTNPND